MNNGESASAYFGYEMNISYSSSGKTISAANCYIGTVNSYCSEAYIDNAICGSYIYLRKQ